MLTNEKQIIQVNLGSLLIHRCFFHLKQKKSAGIDLLFRTQPHSTIGAEGLDFCVRYGNRYIPFARDTSKLVYLLVIYVR